MALNVQTDAGDVANANAYVVVADFKAYHDDRGNAYTPYTDPQISAAIIRATDYLDSRFRFKGMKLTPGQTTQWPRQTGNDVFVPWWDVNFITPDLSFSGPAVPLSDPDGNPIVGIPAAVKKATSEYALRALSSPLFRDAVPDDSGRLISEESVTVDVITRSVKYEPAQGTGAFQMPAYPIADLMLARAGLVEIGRSLYR